MARNVKKFGTSDKRGRAATNSDPYLNNAGRKEICLCLGCQAVYRNKRWLLDPGLFKELEASGTATWVTCPACRKMAEKYPEGIVTLQGDYLWQHESEIRNILQNEAERIRQRNPLERIMRMEKVGGSMVIETTAEKLAEHLGRAVQRAHQGQLQIKWARERTAVCRVDWVRQ